MATDKIELWQNFNAGLSNYAAPNQINANMAATCRDVWYDKLALSKRRQIVVSTEIIDTSYAGIKWSALLLKDFIVGATEYLVSCARPYHDTSGTTAVQLATRALLTYSGAWTIQKLSTAGTVAVTNASGVVTGTSTAFLTTAKVGGMLIIDSYATGTSVNIAMKRITVVTSDTEITVTPNFTNTASGLAYTITAGFPVDNSRPSFVLMNDKLYACGVQVTSVSWDGTNQSWETAFPAARFAITFKNYVFAANTIANPSRISWSSIKLPATWPASNFIDITPDDGQEIVGHFSNGQSIVILKNHSAYILTGDVFDPSNVTYALSSIKVPTDFYINTAASVQPWKGGFIMLGRFGLYFYNGIEILKLNQFDRVLDEFTNVQWFYPTTGTLGTYAAAEPKSLIIGNRYWCCAASSSYAAINDFEVNKTPNVMFVVDQDEAFWIFVTSNGLSGLAYYGGNPYGVQVASLTINSFVRVDTTTGAETINGSWTSKVFEFAKQQRFGHAFVYFKEQSAGNLTFEYSIDEGAFTSVTVAMSGTGTRLKSNIIAIGQIGRAIQFRLSNSTASQLLEIYGIELHRQELRI